MFLMNNKSHAPPICSIPLLFHMAMKYFVEFGDNISAAYKRRRRKGGLVKGELCIGRRKWDT